MLWEVQVRVAWAQLDLPTWATEDGAIQGSHMSPERSSQGSLRWGLPTLSLLLPSWTWKVG